MAALRRSGTITTMTTVDQQGSALNAELPFTFTESAGAKAAELLRATAPTGYSLRIGVRPGGCSGLRYSLYFDNEVNEGDTSGSFPTSNGSLDVVVDRLSAPYLTGATIRYHDTIDRQGFEIDNPNAHGTCSCGDSFH